MAGEPATFRFNGSVFSGASFIWSWGDDTVNTTTSEPQANHIYGNTGEYTITLTVMSTLDLGGDWSVSSEWLQNVGTYSTSVTVNPSDAEESANTVVNNMYVAIGLVGVSLIVLACALIVKSLQFGIQGGLMFGVLLLIGSVVGLVVGLIIVARFEGTMDNLLFLLSTLRKSS